MVGPALLHEDSPMAEGRPHGRREAGVELRPHQRTLLQRCRAMESGLMQECGSHMLSSRVGVMGDTAGAGKSYVMLALAAGDVAHAPADPPITAAPSAVASTYSGGRVVLTHASQRAAEPCTLLVVPHSLCSQWECYLRMFDAGLRYALVSRKRHLDQLSQALSSEGAGIAQVADIVMVTSTLHNELAAVLRAAGCRMQRVIYDEADSLAFNGGPCAEVDAVFYWFATASYKNLVYPRGRHFYDDATSLVRRAAGVRARGFVRDMFDALPPHITRALVVRNDEQFVHASLRLPCPEVMTVMCEAPASVRLLHGLVDREVIEALNAGDVVGAMQHACLRNCHDTDENIVTALVERLKRQASNVEARLALLDGLHYDSAVEREAEGAMLHRRRADMAVRMAAIQERILGTGSCCICFEQIKTKAVCPSCSNAMCFECLARWISRTPSCPLCKTPTTIQDVHVSAGQAQGCAEPTPKPCEKVPSKMQGLARVLHHVNLLDEPRRRLLICSSYENTFAEVGSVLDGANLRHCVLRGNHYVTDRLVEAFRSDGLDALLVNTRDHGCGLNLETASDVIIMHRLEAELEGQVIGRAQRCGRERPLRVWRLMYENEA